jgi:hypothetical protein
MFATRFHTLFQNSRQNASVLVLTLMMMLVFSSQILMMGLVSTKSLTESGAFGAMSLIAREAAYQAMDDFELKEVYPVVMSVIATAKADTGSVNHLTQAEIMADYGKTATPRQDGVGVNWSAYVPAFWNADTDAYVNGDYRVNVWLEPGPAATDGWPYQVVAQVKGNGINQTLRRETRLVPDGYSDF